jgi:hypothetical protein
MRILVTGATTWTDAERIRQELSALPAGSILIHGDAPGVDALAGQIGHELGMKVIRMAKNAEDYRRFGRAAWKGLNERMLQQGVELVLAFHTELGDTSRAHGTRHAIELAQHQGIEVRVIDGNDPPAFPPSPGRTR